MRVDDFGAKVFVFLTRYRPARWPCVDADYGLFWRLLNRLFELNGKVCVEDRTPKVPIF